MHSPTQEHQPDYASLFLPGNQEDSVDQLQGSPEMLGSKPAFTIHRPTVSSMDILDRIYEKESEAIGEKINVLKKSF